MNKYINSACYTGYVGLSPDNAPNRDSRAEVLAMPERVLIVDDDPVQRRLLEGLVGKLGFEPVVATGGDAAVALLADPDAPAIDAVVLDLVMPDLDGLGVLAKLREAMQIELVRLQKSVGITFVIVTHDLALAASCQRQLSLRDGVLAPA